MLVKTYFFSRRLIEGHLDSKIIALLHGPETRAENYIDLAFSIVDSASDLNICVQIVKRTTKRTLYESIMEGVKPCRKAISSHKLAPHNVPVYVAIHDLNAHAMPLDSIATKVDGLIILGGTIGINGWLQDWY